MDKLRNNHRTAIVTHLLQTDADSQAILGRKVNPTLRSAAARENKNQLIVLRSRFLEIMRYITKLFPRTVNIEKNPPKTQNKTSPTDSMILLVRFLK